LGRNRRINMDYEYRVQRSETMIDIAARASCSIGSHRLIFKHPLNPFDGLPD
jgi:hypothetical protein